MVGPNVQFNTVQKNSDVPGVSDIDPREVQEKRAQVLVIDVRRPDEFTGELGHIPGAENIVLNVLPMHIQEIPQDKSVVFVCLSGGRSARACAFAQAHGIQNVFNMMGGMIAWNQLGFAVEGQSEG
jgi:rhodanese-related sulfurtransferase